MVVSRAQHFGHDLGHSSEKLMSEVARADRLKRAFAHTTISPVRLALQNSAFRKVVRSSGRAYALLTRNAGRRRNNALAKMIEQVFVAQRADRLKIRCARKSREQLIAG